MKTIKKTLKLFFAWCFCAAAICLFVLPESADKVAVFLILVTLPPIMLAALPVAVKIDDWYWRRWR